MRWEKIGHVFSPDSGYAWMHSHAANPFVLHLRGELFRVYFTCRDAANRSHVANVDIELLTSRKVYDMCSEPLLTPGEAGLFDDSGCSVGCIINTGLTQRIYYLGWNLSKTVPWRNSIGMAEWDENAQRFMKCSRAPILDRSDEDPFSISYPWIMQDQGIYKMWYGSNLSWGSDQSQMNHVIKYAESQDGLSWRRRREVAVGLKDENEYALSKPIVIKEHNIYRMWYSYRGNGIPNKYRIGYAESTDGATYIRRDELVGIDVSPEGWDSEMICYPFIFDHLGKRYMVYNGNGYGKTGFGLAVLDFDHL